MANHELLGGLSRVDGLAGLLRMRSEVAAVGNITGKPQVVTMSLIDGEIGREVKEINTAAVARKNASQ